MTVATRVLTAVVPLALMLLLAALVSGPLSLGGGEKDIVLVIPLLLWSLLFLCCELLLWWRGVSLGRSVALSAGISTALVVIALVVLGIVLQVGR